MNSGGPAVSSGRPAPFPWDEAMGFAFTVLHLSPQAFWAMTPRELAAAVRFARGTEGGPGATRASLDALMAAFPDGSRNVTG